MSGSQNDNNQPFIPRVAIDEAGGTAARWWNQSLDTEHADRLSRRKAIGYTLGIGGGVLAVGILGAIGSSSDDDGVDSAMDALELQRRTSWNVGDTDRPLALADRRAQDADDSEVWRSVLLSGGLADALAPREERLRPYYAPTLFQASDRSPDLQRELSPILRDSMQELYDRGRALAETFEDAGRPHDTALVIDLHGPEAVAVAAGLADQFAPVFTFDNWPHPRGVVPSHETLAAALYYLPWLQRSAFRRSEPAPPAFILDANRLEPYRDEVTHFDNRYTVSLPSAARLQSLGVSKILYVRGGAGAAESDDLNADFTELDRSGIPVRLASLGDFEPATVADTSKTPDAGAPATGRGTATRHYYYGGGGRVWSSYYFWNQYGWYHTPAPAPPRGGLRTPPPPAPPPSRASSYRPIARETMFSSRAVGGIAGIGKTKPSGFGRVSIRTSRSSGSISVGRGRSGSFGRGSSSFG